MIYGMLNLVNFIGYAYMGNIEELNKLYEKFLKTKDKIEADKFWSKCVYYANLNDQNDAAKWLKDRGAQDDEDIIIELQINSL